MRGEIGKHVAGACHPYCVSLHERVMREVLEDHGFSYTVRSDEDDVCAIIEEAESEQVVDAGTFDLTGPLPVEVDDGLESTDACMPYPACEASTLSLSFLDVE